MTPSLLDIQFLGLLTAVILLRAALPTRFQRWIGPLASAVLIGLASLPTLALIGGLAVLYLYPLGPLIQRAKRRGDDPKAGRLPTNEAFMSVLGGFARWA